MRTSTPRAPRRSQQIAVRTVTLAEQASPTAFVSLGYGMSTPEPLQDPCGYAAMVSGPNCSGNPAQRITQCLGPTAGETEALISGNTDKCPKRSTDGDPVLKLAQRHDIESLKASICIRSVPADQYELPKPADRVASTPLRRVHEGPHQGSTSKRQRIGDFTPGNTSVNTTMNTSMLLRTPADEDVSLDTVRSVLRLVDESLINTPERKSAVTPRVLRAQPVPSPRERGPAFAYAANSQLDKLGGLAGRQVPLAPFGFSRV